MGLISADTRIPAKGLTHLTDCLDNAIMNVDNEELPAHEASHVCINSRSQPTGCFLPESSKQAE